jgi:hypothetical protein
MSSRPAGFGVAVLCAATLSLCSGASSQATNPPQSTTGSALPEDIVAGSIYSPDGITHIVGDGMGGGFVFGSGGLSTFINNGMGGGTLYAPNSTGAIISDGMGGGVLYSPRRNAPSTRHGSRELVSD